MQYTFVIEKDVSEDMLKRIVMAAESSNTALRKQIAQNDQIAAQAKLRLLAAEMEGAERE